MGATQIIQAVQSSFERLMKEHIVYNKRQERVQRQAEALNRGVAAASGNLTRPGAATSTSPDSGSLDAARERSGSTSSTRSAGSRSSTPLDPRSIVNSFSFRLNNTFVALREPVRFFVFSPTHW
jgi:hypothetical protein